MEVHHHSHTARKKWTHYFWEFLMLFLAVFCGFLAENQREHMVEHRREKQYMISLMEDLETDTTELEKSIRNAESAASLADSTVIFLTSYKPSNQVPARLADFITGGGARLFLIGTDRTSSQLKNSGAMRLIRKKNVADSIIQYWKQIDETNISLNRYSIYREAGRVILFKLLVSPSVYNVALQPNQDSVQQLRVIDQDTKKWDELTNLISISGAICRSSILRDYYKQYESAVNLIASIKKEYRLE